MVKQKIIYFYSQLSAQNFMDIVNLYMTQALNRQSVDDLIDKVIQDPKANAIEVSPLMF